MSIIAKDSGGGSFTPAPEGTHVARCISVVDLGTQRVEWKGEEKHQRKVRVAWELPDETIENKETGALRPMVVAKNYTLSLHEKAGLRHDLEAWRGRAFTEAERAGFDIAKLVAATCLLTIVHKRVDDKVYANVTTVSKIPRTMAAPPEMHNKPIVWSLEDGRNDVFKAFPEWLQKKIGECVEWTMPPQEDPGGQAPGSDEPPMPNGDDVPF